MSCHEAGEGLQIVEPRFGVGAQTLTLVDPSRETPACPWYPGDNQRKLITEIWYPTSWNPSLGTAEVRDAPAASSHAPYPLIVWSHGFVNSRRSLLFLIPELVHRGFVVLGADYPSTSVDSPCKVWLGDGAQQALDVRFLIDTFLNRSSDPLDAFSGLIDPQRIGALGHSFGGFTSLLAGYSRDLGDPRIQAVLVSSPFTCLFDKTLFSRQQVPVFFIGGNRDGILPFSNNAEDAFEMAPPPKFLVEVDGGTHFGFRDLPESNDVNVGKILSLLGFDPTDLGDIRPEDFTWGPLRHFTEDLFHMIHDVGGSLETCDFSMPEPLVIPPENVPRQHEIFVRVAIAFFNQTLRGVPDRQGTLDGIWASEQPDVRFLREE
jgi:predicted dienelactone hydrolase